MKSPLGKKVRTVAIGALATAALSLPAATAVSVVAHDAGKAPVVKPASHRLAMSFSPASLRLT
jgi:hypothetical protein